MNTTQKPSEHAMRAASIISHQWTNSDVEDDAEVIDQHAIAPAMAEVHDKLDKLYQQKLAEFGVLLAERDKRIAELEEALRNMLGAHMEVSPNERWNCMEIAAIEATTVLAKKGQP